MFDAHTHLNADPLFAHWQDHMRSFIQAGGKGLVNIGIDEAHNLRACQISEESLNLFAGTTVKCTVGIHPCEVVDRKKNKADLDHIRNYLEEMLEKYADHIVGIGECGIDLHYPGSQETLDDQKAIFHLQCEIARQHKLPVIIHSRDAFDQTLEVLQEFTDLKIYMHCRGYGPEEILACVKMFPQLRIGYTGVVTYPKATNIRESLMITPSESILTETDAPYLAPQPVRSQTNEPAFLKHTVNFLEEETGLEPEIFEENARRLYGV